MTKKVEKATNVVIQSFSKIDITKAATRESLRVRLSVACNLSSLDKFLGILNGSSNFIYATILW